MKTILLTADAAHRRIKGFIGTLDDFATSKHGEAARKIVNDVDTGGNWTNPLVYDADTEMHYVELTAGELATLAASDTVSWAYVSASTKYFAETCQVDIGVAKESTLLALGSPLQDDDVRLPATIIASKADVNGSFLGLLYSVISLPGMEAEFLPIKIAKGEHRTFSWEIKEGGVAKDISAYTAKMGIKLNLDDTTYELGPIDGVISANADGVMSILSITFMTADTDDAVPCDGLYAVALYKDGEKYKLTQAGGVEFSLIEDILDIPVVP